MTDTASAPPLVRPPGPSDAPGPLDGLMAGLLTCVHCGFCLPACPTYLTLGDESDSPRGRILLMRAVAEGELAIDDEVVGLHLDRCLGCRGCETACPSGVPYGHLLEVTRDAMRREGGRTLPWVARAILGVFARPWLLKPALALSRLLRSTRIPWLLARLPGRLGFAMGMLDASRPALRTRPYSPREPAAHRAALLRGCVMDGLFSHQHAATRRALRVNGWATVETPGAGCCGALHLHAGVAEDARALARRNIEAFERSGADLYVVNAAGCGAMMKDYGHLFADDPAWRDRAAAFSSRVRDISEVLAAAGPVPGGAVARRVTYDAPCHLLHAQRIADPPHAVLGAVQEMVVVPLPDAEQCCGAAGIYNLVEPETSAAVLAPKIAAIAETQAELVATGNPGCHMQIGAGLARDGRAARVVHPVELLDAAYAAARRV